MVNVDTKSTDRNGVDTSVYSGLEESPKISHCCSKFENYILRFCSVVTPLFSLHLFSTLRNVSTDPLFSLSELFSQE